jgi:hypothetical protein
MDNVMISRLMRPHAPIFAIFALCMYLVATCFPLVLCRETDGSQRVETQLSASCGGMFLAGSQCGGYESPAQHALCDGTFGCHDFPLIQPHHSPAAAYAHAVPVPLDTPVPAVVVASLVIAGGALLPVNGSADFSPAADQLRAHRTVVRTC